MFGIIDFPTYLIGTILIILLPGPNSLYVMTVASRLGIQTGYRAALGVLTGDTILMLLTVVGAAALLKSVPALFILLKVVGAAYLGYLALQLLRSALQRWKNQHSVATQKIRNLTQKDRPFQRALTISLLNPKAILFFLSFFIQFVDPAYVHPSLSFLILGLVLQICSFAYLSALIFAGTKLAHFFAQHTIFAVLGISAVGILFLAFAFRLVFSTL